jgi:hypothetical protein
MLIKKQSNAKFAFAFALSVLHKQVMDLTTYRGYSSTFTEQ